MRIPLLFLTVFLSLCTVVHSGKIYHRYEKMSFFNIPVVVEKIRPLIPANLSIDTNNGTGWVSIVVSHLTKTTLNGIPVPLIKPYEIQLRTYVSGVCANGTKMNGVWLFDLFLSNGPTVFAGNLFFDNSIPFVYGKIELGAGTNWSANATDLKITNATSTANFHSDLSVGSVIKQDISFFTNRNVWFGAKKNGALLYSPLVDINVPEVPKEVKVSSLSTSALRVLGLGPDLDATLCTSTAVGCFFVGTNEATWLSPFPL